MKRVIRILLVSLGMVCAAIVLLAVTLYIAYDQDLYIPKPSSENELFIRNGTLFDGTGLEPVENPGILVRDEVIACIGSECELSADAIEIDATGLAILPGLIDLHVHFFAITRDNADMSLPRLIWNTARVRPDVRETLLNAGVTSLRDVGSPADAILDAKRMLELHELAGPRLFVAGPLFTAPGGHPTYRGQDPNRSGFGGNMAFQSDDLSVVRGEIERLAQQGADGVKAVFHDAVSPEGEVLLPSLSLETLEVIIQEAKRRGLWVAVHVGAQDETQFAAAVHATTVEHGVRNGNLIDDGTIQTLLANDVVYVPTLGREPQGHLNIPALFDAGVALGVGTDTNNPEMAYGDSYHEELARMVDAGMPAAAVLLSATKNGAKGLKLSDSLGTIEEGKFADIIFVNGSPWRDIGELRSIVAVIQNGDIVVNRR